jgi:hypothetical protein
VGSTRTILIVPARPFPKSAGGEQPQGPSQATGRIPGGPARPMLPAQSFPPSPQRPPWIGQPP